MKYKRIKRKKEKYYVLLIVIIFLLIATGYSLFSDSLNIGGTVHTDYYYGPNLNIELIKKKNYYHYYGTQPKRAKLVSEVWDGNNLTITFNKQNQNIVAYTTELYLDFRNVYVHNLTNGEITRTNLTSMHRYSLMSQSIDKTSLTPNEIGKVTIKFNYINGGSPDNDTVLYELKYTVNGVVQTFNIYIIMKW